MTGWADYSEGNVGGIISPLIRHMGQFVLMLPELLLGLLLRRDVVTHDQEDRFPGGIGYPANQLFHP